MNILILMTEVSASAPAEDQDDIRQAEAVARALTRLGHLTSFLPMPADRRAAAAALRAAGPEVVVNLVESVGGLGRLIGTAPSLLETMGLPYTGCDARALSQTSNKLEAKRLLRSWGLPTPDWRSPRELRDDAGGEVRGRYICKSVWEHGSLGLGQDSVVEVESPAELRQALEDRLEALRGQAFAERLVEGREFNVGVLTGPDGGEPLVLPPAELLFLGDWSNRATILGHAAKWDEEAEEYASTQRSFDHAASDAPLLREMERLALACWRRFRLRGYARVDFRVDRENRPFIIDINANPCLSPDAGFPAALERAGVSFDQCVERLVKDALSAGLSRRSTLLRRALADVAARPDRVANPNEATPFAATRTKSFAREAAGAHV